MRTISTPIELVACSTLLGFGTLLSALLGASIGSLARPIVALGGVYFGALYAAAFVLLLLPATRVFLEERRRLREGDPHAVRR